VVRIVLSMIKEPSARLSEGRTIKRNGDSARLPNIW
jgi:hypothetical protein